jgi:hypothetical protein
MTAGDPSSKRGEDLSAEERAFVRSLLDKVPPAAATTGNKSSWMARHRRDFEMTDQYGDAE